VLNGNAARRWLAAGNPDEAGKAAERIVRDAERASELIRRLRDLTRKAAGKAVRLDVNQLIAETLTLVENEAGRSHVSLRTELAGKLPRAEADPVQIQQVILNLILNAIEATSGEQERDVTIVTSAGKPGEIVIEVRDSGRGLSGVQLDHVFDAFYTTKPEGLGMGLAISRSIIESHGGRIWAQPAMPRGAAFFFLLPAGRTGSRGSNQ